MERINMGKPWTLVMGSVVAGAVLVSGSALIGVNPSTSAQVPDQTPTPGVQNNDNDVDRTYSDYLADELDVTVDELREAEENARNAYIDSLVDSGDLTDQQAAGLRAMLPGQIIQGILQDEDDIDLVERAVLGEIANAFDMPRQELRDELDDDRNLQEIAQERNIDLDEARDNLQGATDNVIANLEQAGLIDQGEAQELRDRVDQIIDDMFQENDVDDNDVTTPAVPTPTPDNDDDNDVLPDLPNNDNNN